MIISPATPQIGADDSNSKVSICLIFSGSATFELTFFRCNGSNRLEIETSRPKKKSRYSPTPYNIYHKLLEQRALDWHLSYPFKSLELIIFVHIWPREKKYLCQCVIHSFFDGDGFELYLSTGFMFSLNILKDYQLLAMPNDGVLQGYECSSYFG